MLSEETKIKLAKQDRLHVRFYFLFVGLLCASIATQIVYFFSGPNHELLWQRYTFALMVLFLAYTWYVLLLLFLNDVRVKTTTLYKNERIAVLVPCYNEEPELLRRCVRSISECVGRKEIIIVNDGSTNNLTLVLKELALDYGAVIHGYKKNQGKRKAIYEAAKIVRLLNRNASLPITHIVTVDSDTILDKDSLVSLVKILKEQKVGAVTGQVRVLNEQKNVLTRMVGAYYWSAINIFRNAQSALGIVSCCSGCLAGYRAEVFLEAMDDFLGQTFMGKPCTYSEDRHLTNLFLMREWRIQFASSAIAYTESPATIAKFLKQQLRWKRGAIRESALTLSYAWRTRKMLFWEILMWDLGSVFYTMALRTTVILIAFLNPGFFVLVILPAWLMATFMRNITLIWEAKDKIVGLVIFTIFHEFVLYWQNLYALFTVTNRNWITRTPR